MKLRNKLTGTHTINMFQPDSERQARLVLVGGSVCVRGKVSDMFRGDNSSWKSGSHRVQTILSDSFTVCGKKSMNPHGNQIPSPPDELLFHFYNTLCIVANRHKFQKYLHNPSGGLSVIPNGSFCQKTRRTSKVPANSKAAAGAFR